MRGLSRRQSQVLGLIEVLLLAGETPSSAQLAAQLGLAGESSVAPHLEALARKGYLTISRGGPGRRRRLELTAKARQEHAARRRAVDSILAGAVELS